MSIKKKSKTNAKTKVRKERKPLLKIKKELLLSTILIEATGLYFFGVVIFADRYANDFLLSLTVAFGLFMFSLWNLDRKKNG